MKVGDLIRIAPPNTRIKGLFITEIGVLSKNHIKVSFLDNLNMGIELNPDMGIRNVYIFDSRPGGAGAPVGMLLRDDRPSGTVFIKAEKFPNVRLRERLELVRKKLSQMVHDSDFTLIAQNLSKINFSSN